MEIVHRGGQTYVKATVQELVDLWGHEPHEWGWSEDTSCDRTLYLRTRRDTLHIETERLEKDSDGFLKHTDGAGLPQLRIVDEWTEQRLGQPPEDVFLELCSQAEREADMIARVYANGEDMGVYEGEDEAAVLDAYAQDAGYEDFADLLDRVPDASRDEVTLEEVTVDSMQEEEARNEGYRMGKEDGYSRGLEDGEEGVRHHNTPPDSLLREAVKKAPRGELEGAYEAGYEEGWEDGYEDGFETTSPRAT